MNILLLSTILNFHCIPAPGDHSHKAEATAQITLQNLDENPTEASGSMRFRLWTKERGWVWESEAKIAGPFFLFEGEKFHLATAQVGEHKADIILDTNDSDKSSSSRITLKEKSYLMQCRVE